MTFALPICLIAFAPWAALVIWFLSGRLEKSSVPFLNLWPSGAPHHPKPKRAWEKPPLSLIALLSAMFLAIFAAARPLIHNRKSSAVTIIVDRGLGSRFTEAAKKLDASLRQDFPNATVDLRIVPNTDSITGDGWLSQTLSLQPTAVEDSDELTLACRQALSSSSGPVILLSDQTIELTDPRLVQFASPEPITNVGIDLLSVRSGLMTQAMVRLFNQSKLTAAELDIRADGKIVQSRQITLPPAGQKRDYFIDIPAEPTVVEAEVQCNDLITINHRAWVVRRAAWPIVEPAGSLPPELIRMIEVYARHRIPSEGSPHIAVINESDSTPTGTAAVILANNKTNSATKLSTIEPLTIAGDFPGMQSVDWIKILSGAMISSPPGKDWHTIVSAGGTTIIAVRTTPQKQAWIGFRTEDFARRPDFVIFWSAIFDWLGSGGSPEYASSKTGLLTGNWHLQEPKGEKVSAGDAGLVPGLYKSGDGILNAVNASAPIISPASQENAEAKLNFLAALHNQSAPIAGTMLITAMALICLSAITWRTRK